MWPRARPGCGRGPGWRPAWTPCSWTRRASCRWPTCWRWPGRRGTGCCSATRSSSPSRVTSRTRPARAPPRSARAHPGRPGDDAGGRRAAARPDLADAPGPVPVHLSGVLRRQAARGRRAGPPGDPGLGLRAAPRRGAAPGQHQRLAGRGPRGGAAGGAADRPDMARQEWDRTSQETHGHPDRHAYNAQIRAIEAALSASGQTGFRVGTVDKCPGQEAPVVIYSMATSSADEAPRGLDFLYDPHRLNVATSRATALAIIVASPDLIRVSCRTPHQMVLANALCRPTRTELIRNNLYRVEH